MIKTREDLREYIEADRSRHFPRKPAILGFLLRDESYVIVKYLETLRHLEYYTNNKSGLLNKLMRCYYSLKHRHNMLRTNIRIMPNVVGKGLYIPHLVGGGIVNAYKLGDYCILGGGSIVGNKGDRDSKPTIGNRVEICIGAKIIGKVTIGNDVIIAPNSVVIKDVPDNAIVSGVPAKIIKYKNIAPASN